jgi:cytidine deaminase
MTSPTTDALVDLAVEAARAAREHAYAPYSNFLMGAAVVTSNGETTEGVLIENVSLGLAMCAERVALFSAVTRRLRPEVLALCSKRTGDEFTFPCGACLQVALEIAGPELVVVAVDPGGGRARHTLAELLPRGPKRHTPGA